MTIETVSLMKEDTEEFCIKYAVETLDALDCTPVIPICTGWATIYSEDCFKHKSGLMDRIFRERIWDENNVMSSILLAVFGLSEYNPREIARKTLGVCASSSSSLWFWFHDMPRMTWVQVRGKCQNEWNKVNRLCQQARKGIAWDNLKSEL